MLRRRSSWSALVSCNGYGQHSPLQRSTRLPSPRHLVIPNHTWWMRRAFRAQSRFGLGRQPTGIGIARVLQTLTCAPTTEFEPRPPMINLLLASAIVHNCTMQVQTQYNITRHHLAPRLRPTTVPSTCHLHNTVNMFVSLGTHWHSWKLSQSLHGPHL